ncbi:PQQ-dependent sugar dehydrogenase [Arenibacter sp. ARW7G5Y1]|uniref:PQQ-dependent sugar dehydrogenase n=1 Tax=Arenibacter sp. ARW7G5Y1 TaxID=2135619 RepID=UPI000D769730|nr:PQQ-dependent sugar dehydrogenase [Arenibacter sp. ARW7G5Y1]PXX23713.1 cytochrome c [Arenibacter sp. ARW7G5Y1]
MNCYIIKHTRGLILLCTTTLMLSCGPQERTLSLYKPENNRFEKIVLADQLDEPMQFKVFKDGRVLFVERKGKIKVFDPQTKQVRIIGDIPVSKGYYSKTGEELSPRGEDGMQGVALDPNFDMNGWIYLYYSPEGGKHRSILTRYEWKGNSIVLDSKKVLLEVPNQRESCCHLGGGMIFDKDGNLLLSTGDNSQNDPTGNSPLDERTDRSLYDAQRTSGNTNDLRGKILRIQPESDGSYSIPKGNLFPEGTEGTRPEIYTMGNRNPWRLSIDSKTGWLYWGEVGPHGMKDSVGRGPKSYDEFNRAIKSGNYGWPYFSADNKAYWEYDYESGESLQEYDPDSPINNSPHNTGLTNLPPTTPAFIWYPQSQAIDFPLLGSGSNSAVGGPIYRQSDFQSSQRAFPEYYEGKWFITDWTRGWIMVVTMDENGDFESMEEFFPGINLVGPIDMDFGPEGDLYILEYGRGPYRRNQEARLIKIKYNEGNRKPHAIASALEKAGTIPFKVKLSSEGTYDFDDDSLEYRWTINSDNGYENTIMISDPEIILAKPGIYKVDLTVIDSQGAEDMAGIELYAGNEPPKVSFNFKGNNRSFFFPEHTINYSVVVDDLEDGSLGQGISSSEVDVQIDYLQNNFYWEELEPILLNTMATDPVHTVLANLLINKSDCRSCHLVDNKAIGPSYEKIADRYVNRPEALEYLTDKIMFGGMGNWDKEMAMPAHPAISKEDAGTIAKYILSLKDKKAEPLLDGKGSFTTTPILDSLYDNFIIRASYTDKGGISTPELMTTEMLVLRNSNIPVVSFDNYINIETNHSISPDYSTISPKESGAALALENVDLTGIREVLFYPPTASGIKDLEDWKIEVRIDSIQGELLGITDQVLTDDGMVGLRAKLATVKDYHDIYFVFNKKNEVIDRNGGFKIWRVKFVQ